MIREKNNVMPLVAKYQNIRYICLAYITKVINIPDVINTILIGVRQ